jgi:hypothetical protein
VLGNDPRKNVGFTSQKLYVLPRGSLGDLLAEVISNFSKKWTCIGDTILDIVTLKDWVRSSSVKIVYAAVTLVIGVRISIIPFWIRYSNDLT